jgi:hypothetical protein
LKTELWDDLEPELSSKEPDLESVDELLKQLNVVGVKVYSNNWSERVHIVPLIGYKNCYRISDRINQIGHRILLVTDILPFGINNFKGVKYALPNNRRVKYEVSRLSLLLIGIRFDDMTNSDFELMFDCMITKPFVDDLYQVSHFGDTGSLLNLMEGETMGYTEEMLSRSKHDSDYFYAQGTGHFKAFDEFKEVQLEQTAKLKDEFEIVKEEMEVNLNNLKLKLLQTGLSEDIAEGVIDRRRTAFDEEINSKTPADKKLKILIDMLVKGEGMEKIILAKDDVIAKTMTVQSVNQIMHNPNYLGYLSSAGKTGTKTLKEPKLLAEMESLMGEHLRDCVLNGTLCIRKATKDDMLRNIKMFERCISINDPKFSEKRFLVDTFAMILRDAFIDSSTSWNQLDIDWNEFRSKLTEIIIDDNFDAFSERSGLRQPVYNPLNYRHKLT